MSETPNLEFDVIAQHFKMVRYKGLRFCAGCPADDTMCFLYIFLLNIYYVTFITFRMSRRGPEMCIGNARLCVCVCLHVSLCMSVPRRIPALLHGSGCNLGMVGSAP